MRRLSGPFFFDVEVLPGRRRAARYLYAEKKPPRDDWAAIAAGRARVATFVLCGGVMGGEKRPKQSAPVQGHDSRPCFAVRERDLVVETSPDEGKNIWTTIAVRAANAKKG